MADGGGKRSRPRKRNLASMEELIKESKELLGTLKRKRKPVYFEFSTDPVTGLRSNKGTYTGQQGKKRPEIYSETSDNSFAIDSNDTIDDTACISNQTSTHSIITGAMKTILLEARELMNNWQQNDLPKKQNWADRQSLLNESWAESRSIFLEAVLRSTFAIPEDEKCQSCMENNAILKCCECSPAKLLCHDCDNYIHSSIPFHDRDAFVNGHYIPIPATTSRSAEGEWLIVGRSLPLASVQCTTCNTKCNPMETSLHESHCIVVTLRGRFDLNHQKYQCPECFKVLSSSDPLVVIQSGFWPGSVKDMSYVFHQDLFLQWDILQKQIPGISERSFLKSLELFSKRKGRVPVINAIAFGVSFKEWKFCQFELDKLRHIDWLECPACSNFQQSVHVDGNMKLYRFRSAGVRKRDNYYGEAFVASNEKVDSHIHKLYLGSKQRKADEYSKCGDSNWRAAGNTIKRKKNLSETGLEIAGCRHGLAQHAINMMYGEVYGYAHYLQVPYYIPKKVEFFWYDVVCKYWPWLMKHDRETAQKMKPALSVMHSKAHAWSCQALWGGRWQNGAAATTGEEVEQINSHFSRLGSCTKHMLPEGREELLTEHAIHWNRRKIVGLPRSLAKRYNKGQSQLNKLHGEIIDLLKSLGLKETDVSLESWKDEVLQIAREEETSYNKKQQLSSEEHDFLCHLKTLDKCTPKEKLLHEIAYSMYGKKIQDLKPKPCVDAVPGETLLIEKTVLYLQMQMEHLHYTVTQIALNMGKVADGSKQRHKLRSKISSEKTKLEETVEKYNKLSNASVTIQEVENGSFTWKADSLTGGAVPVRTKRLVVDKYMESLRFEEELKLLQNEMMGFVQFYKNVVLPSLVLKQQQLRVLLKENDSDKTSHPDESCVSDEGNRYVTSSNQREVLVAKLALLQDGKDFAMKQMSAGISAFAPVLVDELDAFSEVLFSPEIECEDDDDDDHQSFSQNGDDEDFQTTSVDCEEMAGFSGNIVTDALGNISVVSITVSSLKIRPGVTCWKFPADTSQGRYKGRNGSNACSVITLLIGYAFNQRNVCLPELHESLSRTIVDVVCGCIEIGNRVYDLCRDSLPSRYLSIQEAASVLEMWVDIEVGSALPVRLKDQHEMSTIAGQIMAFNSSRSSFFGFLILNEKTSLFYISDDCILYVDTHSHEPNGPLLIVGGLNELSEFCKAVWELEGNDDNTYGNFVVVDF